MIRNWFKIAFRTILKNSVYSFINIFGLAAGIASSLLIMLWVNDELSFDKFHENKRWLYQVYANEQRDGGRIASSRATTLPLVEELKRERDILHVTVTDWGGNHLLVSGDKKFMKNGLYVGEDFLKMFSFPLVQGSSEKALQNPAGIVITKAVAIALFDTADALGKNLRVDNSIDATVTAVIDQVPSNSSFQFDFLLPFQSFIASQPWVKASLNSWENNAFQVYVQLNKNASKDAVERRIKNVVKEHSKMSTAELMLHPIEKWRLWSKFENGKSVGGGIEAVRSFSLVAGLILIIACINFMNLATARSESRAKEVGIRKSVGSRRKELIFQFLGESLIVVLIAYVFSLVLTELALPFYNNLVGKKLVIEFGSQIFWIASLIVVIGTGLIAGSYPAFYLSAFRAAAVLKGKPMVAGRGATPRKILVVLQFVLSIFLLVGSVIFNQQLQYGKDRELGYDQENLLIIENQGDIRKNYKVIKNELLSGGLALSATSSNNPITSIFVYMSDIKWPGKSNEQRPSIATEATEYDFVKTLGTTLKEGRDFSEEFNDSTSILLNQAAVEYMNLKNPVGETVTWDGKNYKVIGVTENLLMGSVYKPIEPMMMVFDPSWFAFMVVRLPKGDVSDNLKKIEAVFKKYNPEYPFSFSFADVEFQQKFSAINMIRKISNVFATLAILISCLGLFGLAAFTAEQRTKEIGIRKVMGASVSNVTILLSKDFAKLVLIAFVIAGPLSWWLMDRWLQAFPYRITIQWWVIAFAGAAALVFAIVTVSSQAVKAATANPALSLRNE